ncbi:hypothetical protein Hanom_Chr12g01181701 [Helianthus anomalus]
MDMIEGMPMSSDVFVWGSLLGGCRHEFIAGDHELHPQSDEIYLVLNSIGQHQISNATLGLIYRENYQNIT